MKFLYGLLLSLFVTGACAQGAGTVANHAYAIGKGPGVSGYTSMLCTSAQLAVGQAAADPICRTVTGDWTLSAAGVATLGTVNGNVGTFGSATQCGVQTVNAKGLTTAASQVTCAPAIGSVTGWATGVLAALQINVGSAGAFTTFNGAHGTPSSIVLTNGTGLPASGGLTGSVPFANGGNNDTGTAASTYTPTATCVGGGTLTAAVLTNAGRYKQLASKFFWFKIDVVLTTIGTCVGPIDYSLPPGFTSQGGQPVMGREAVNSGKSMQGRMLNSGTVIRVVYYDNTFAMANGDEPIIEGVVESQ